MLKVKFCDYEPFMIENNFILDTLKKFCEVELSDNPDIVFYSVFGNQHKKYNCTKVFVCAEACAPDFNEADYAISSCDMSFGKRHVYYPFYFMHNIDKLINTNRYDLFDERKQKFCNFIYSHTASRGGVLRNSFCEQLMEYKTVDCLGKVLHNAEDPLLGDRFASNWNERKINVLKKYKFTIAFENTHLYGYSTEKIIDPLLAGSIPIYFGNDGLKRFISSDAYIDANPYQNNLSGLVELVAKIDADDGLYSQYCCNKIVNIKEIQKVKNEFDEFIQKLVTSYTVFEKDPYEFYKKNRISGIPIKTFFYYKAFMFINSHKNLRNIALKFKQLIKLK